jgi:hypothetical protein
MINQFSEDQNIRFVGEESVLAHFGLAGESAWVNLGVLYAFIAAFTCVDGCRAHPPVHEWRLPACDAQLS